MGDVLLTCLTVIAVSLALFFLGRKDGEATAQREVAEVLAKFETATVKPILLALRGEYAREYLDVVNEISKITVDGIRAAKAIAKKAL